MMNKTRNNDGKWRITELLARQQGREEEKKLPHKTRRGKDEWRERERKWEGCPPLFIFFIDLENFI